MTATNDRCPRCDADRDVCDRFRIFPWATNARRGGRRRRVSRR